MESLDLIRRLHRHRHWVNQQLLAAAAGLSDEQLRRQFEIGQGSLWRTLTHLYAGEYVWLETLLGDEQPVAPGDLAEQLPGNQQGAGAAKSLSQLRSRWAELDKRWERYLDSLTTPSLDDSVYKTSSLGGKRAGTRRGDILLHVCTHAHYTSAQAINMLRHLGVTPLPDLMLITLARSESAASG